jgi:hypothetical protein
MPASIKIHYEDPTLDAAKVTSRNPHHRIPWTLWRLARRLMAIPEKKWQRDETTSHKRKETTSHHRFPDKKCGRWGQKNQPQVEKIFQFSDSKVRFHMKSHGSNAAT